MGKGRFSENFQTGLPAGQYCDLISDCRVKVNVDGSGNAHIQPESDNDPVVAIIVGKVVFVCLFVCVFVCLFVCLSVCLSVCLFVCLFCFVVFCGLVLCCYCVCFCLLVGVGVFFCC